MNRRAARFMWTKVASGAIDEEAHAWLEHVARKVLAADAIKGDPKTQSNRRKGALAAATGMIGRLPDVSTGEVLFAIRCYTGRPHTTVHMRDFLAGLFGWTGDKAKSNEAIDKHIDRAIKTVVDPAIRAEFRAIVGRPDKP